MCIKSVKNLQFRLCLFWVKITSGNAFPYLRVFGCARKMHFSEMLFSWPVNGYKLISVFILPSNTHFPENTERVEWEGDAPTRREREREEEPRKPRSAWLRSSSLTALHPKIDRHRPRSSSPTASLDRPRPRSLSSIAISPVVEPNRLRAISPVVEPSRNRIMNFFFWVLFVFLD